MNPLEEKYNELLNEYKKRCLLDKFSDETKDMLLISFEAGFIAAMTVKDVSVIDKVEFMVSKIKRMAAKKEAFINRN